MPEHSFPNGTVTVKMHKRKRLALVAAREDLDAALVDRIETLEHENRILRRKVTELTLSDTPEKPTKEELVGPWVDYVCPTCGSDDPKLVHGYRYRIDEDCPDLFHSEKP